MLTPIMKLFLKLPVLFLKDFKFKLIELPILSVDSVDTHPH